MLKARRCTEQLVERALSANRETLVVTTDAAIFGNREWNKRNFVRPMLLSLRSKLDVFTHPQLAARCDGSGTGSISALPSRR